MFAFSQSFIPWMLILLLLAFILGFLILLVIDRRLSQIRIQVPKPEVSIVYNQNSQEPFTVQTTEPNTKTETEINTSTNTDTEETSDSNPNTETEKNTTDENPNTNTEETTKKEEEPEKKRPVTQQIKHTPNNPIISSFTNQKKKWSGNISAPPPPSVYASEEYGAMNYPFPSQMTEEQRQAFLLGYPPDMTIQDYMNWLWLYRGQESLLDLVHLQNLERIQAGRSLAQLRPPPPSQAAPLNAQDYFERQYPSLQNKNGNEDKNENQVKYGVASPLNHPTRRGVWAANSDQYANYADNWNVSTMRGEVWNRQNLATKDDAIELMRKLTPQIRTPPPPPDAPSPTDPSASPQLQNAKLTRTRGGNAIV